MWEHNEPAVAEPELLKIGTNGHNLAVWHRGAQSEHPYYFVHATGFHARCWDKVIKHLPEHDSYAIDLPGHGLSDRTEPPLKWRNAGSDVANVALDLNIRKAIGIGHSMGGHSLCLAAIKAPELFSALILIDPVILKGKFYRKIGDKVPAYAEHPVAKRRNHWVSHEDMFERFKEKPPFNRWDASVLRDYCSYGVVAAPDGRGFELACPPLLEASIYVESSSPEAIIYGELSKIDVPVLIIRLGEEWNDSKMNFDMSPTNPNLAFYFKNAKDVHIAECTHFMPMERPDLLAEKIQEFTLKLKSLEKQEGVLG
jgi:lipase